MLSFTIEGASSPVERRDLSISGPMDDDGSVRVANEARENGYAPECARCGGELEGSRLGWVHVGSEAPPDCDPEPGPFSWLNSAAVRLDEEDDAVHLTVSVGDPRGAFVMTMRQVKGDDTRCRHCGQELTATDRAHRHTLTGGYDCPGGGGLTHAEPVPERLLLHVPHPDGNGLHMSLTELHPGTYEVGSW